jgi:hypothetical protein
VTTRAESPEDARRLLNHPRARHPPTDAGGWVEVVRRSSGWPTSSCDRSSGGGPQITDDRPRSEYFLWRRAFMDDQRYISEATLRAASG